MNGTHDNSTLSQSIVINCKKREWRLVTLHRQLCADCANSSMGEDWGERHYLEDDRFCKIEQTKPFLDGSQSIAPHLELSRPWFEKKLLIGGST